MELLTLTFLVKTWVKLTGHACHVNKKKNKFVFMTFQQIS
jgi:hypothetical protein